jgi:ERCC4 domain-containing protein
LCFRELQLQPASLVLSENEGSEAEIFSLPAKPINAPKIARCYPHAILASVKPMRRRTLITSPLKWQMTALPVAHPIVPVIAERGGTQLRTPKPIIVVDTREQNPFSFARFAGWFSGIEKRPLEIGDYAIAGLEDTCVVERKDLSDLVRSFHMERSVFVARLRRMSAFPDRLLVITAALSQVKSRYEYSPANPNQITQSLIATLAGLRVPFLCVETHELGEEIIASYLYQVHLYHWLEANGHDRRLADDDL